MAIAYRKWYAFAMTAKVSNRAKIYALAGEKSGIITLEMARSVGVPAVEMRKLLQRGALERVGRGIYRVPFATLDNFEQALEATLLVGEGAYVSGQSVLSMFDVGIYNPARARVASPNRIRKQIPRHIYVTQTTQDPKNLVRYRGVLSESVFDALAGQAPREIFERFVDSCQHSQELGLITAAENRKLINMAKRSRKVDAVSE